MGYTADIGAKIESLYRWARVTSDLGDMDPTAFYIEASTLDVESYAVDLQTAFREVVLPTVATHRAVDGFVAFLGPYTYVYTCTCILVPNCTYRWRMHGDYNVTFSTRMLELEKNLRISSSIGVYLD